MIRVVTPHLQTETEKTVDALAGIVDDLNARLPDFPALVSDRFVRFAEGGFASMPSDYNASLREWLENGAS